MSKPASRTVQGSRIAARPRTRAARQRASLKKYLKTTFVLLFLLVESAIAVGLVIAVVVFWKFSNSLPNIEDLRQDVSPPIATTIWSEDGVLLGKLQVENRQPVALTEIPKDLINATIAIEDHRFYEHPGVDIQGIGRATLANFAGSSATRQGASTLTQQLVRNIDSFGLTKEKKFSRKIQEALTAMRLEQLYSKNEVLGLYLNNIYYGSGAYGVQAASRTYFGKSAYKLSLAESALLAGLPQRPSSFTPFEHRKTALKRRDEVLDNMYRYHYITLAQLVQAKAEKPKLMPQQKHKDYNFKAPYFVWHVLSELIRHYGVDFVYSGLKIETTLNWKMQQEAEKDLEIGLREHAEDGPNQGALVAIDNNTGYIRAMVGGRNYRASQYNNVTMGRRQPGSTFKIFDYSAAFDQGKCSLYDSFIDKPIPYPNDPRKIVRNFSGDGAYSYAEVTCKTAIQFSKNTIAVQVADTVGINKVIEYAHTMGITTPLQPVLPTALGASEVHPLDLASAYTIFPLKGSRYTPMALVRVYERNGSILEEHIPEIHTGILKAHTVEQMDEALEAVVTAGSGTAARQDSQGNIVENAHGKTGTTSDSKDAWFAGYTPELTAVVWVAQVHHYNQKHPTWPSYMSMGGVTGGHVCAPIWHDFMFKAVPEQRKFHLPGNPMLAVAPAPPKEGDDKEGDVKETDEERRARRARRKRDNAKALTDKQATPGDKAVQPTPGTGDPLPENGDGTPVTAPPDLPPVKPPDNNPDTNPQPEKPDKTDKGDKSALAPRPPQLPKNRLAGEGTSRPALSHSETPTRPQPLHTDPPRAAPITRIAPPPHADTPRPAAPEMVDVSVCVESGGLATPWCTETNRIKVTANQAKRMRRCRTHKPPPGEG